MHRQIHKIEIYINCITLYAFNTIFINLQKYRFDISRFRRLLYGSTYSISYIIKKLQSKGTSCCDIWNKKLFYFIYLKKKIFNLKYNIFFLIETKPREIFNGLKYSPVRLFKYKCNLHEFIFSSSTIRAVHQ